MSYNILLTLSDLIFVIQVLKIKYTFFFLLNKHILYHRLNKNWKE